jgi:hypothetical protein
MADLYCLGEFSLSLRSRPTQSASFTIVFLVVLIVDLLMLPHSMRPGGQGGGSWASAKKRDRRRALLLVSDGHVCWSLDTAGYSSCPPHDRLPCLTI